MLSAFATSTTINQLEQVLTTVLNHTEPLSFAAGRLYTTLSVADAAAATAFIAQAEPRPVRQRYEQAITDAAVVLGYLNPDVIAGGRVALRPDLAERAIDEHIARPAHLPAPAATL